MVVNTTQLRQLCQLHWLPVEQRILYKILLLTYKALNGLAPLYLCDMLERYIPVRRLRPSDNYHLSVPRYNLKSYGGRAFSVVAPKLWNNLPLDIKLSPNVNVFKSKLKTYLFKYSYY